jgi:hypothetical protein
VPTCRDVRLAVEHGAPTFARRCGFGGADKRVREDFVVDTGGTFADTYAKSCILLPCSQQHPYSVGTHIMTTTQASPFIRTRTDPHDRVVPLSEAVTITGLSADTLKRCNRRGELKIIRLSPRRVGIRLSDLWAFIEARAA